MKNYEISSLKNNGFNNRPQLQDVYNNNYKNRIPYSHHQRMMSSQELNKNKGNNIQFDPIYNRDFNPYQTQYGNFREKRERNTPLGNNMINYHLPRGGSQYNLNSLRRMNNQFERENLNIINNEGSIKLRNNMDNNDMNNFYKTRTGQVRSKFLDNNNLNINVRPYNNNTNKINTSPNEIMNIYNNNNEDNEDNQEEYENDNDNDEDIDDIANEINDYNNNSINNLIKENKLLTIQINKLQNEKSIMEKKANEIIKVNNALLIENQNLNKKVAQCSNIINSYRNSKNVNNQNLKNVNQNTNNNKDAIIQKYMEENKMLKLNYNKLLKQQKNLQNKNNVSNNNNSANNIKEINYYKVELNKLKEQFKKNQQTLKEKELLIKDLNTKLFSLNEDVNKKQEEFNNNINIKNENLLKEKYEKEINELKFTIENNKKNINDTNNNIDTYIKQIKELKEDLDQKDKKVKDTEKNIQLNEQIITDLKNKNQQYEINNKKLEKENTELKIQLNNREVEDNLNDDDMINSFTKAKIDELEENNETLKTKNEELISKLEEKNKEIELYKEQNKDNNITKEKYEELKNKYELALKDCENYKKVNDILLNNENKNKEMILKYNEEKENLNKSMEKLKEKTVKFEKELKFFRKTEKNPFKMGDFELEDVKKEEARYSLGAKEARTERYKKMLLDYETQNKNDLNQMNMLKQDIKGLKNQLKEKQKIFGDIKTLIETGYKDINGGNKTQKEAIKKLKEILNNL